MNIKRWFMLFITGCTLAGPARAGPLRVYFDNASVPTQYACADGSACGIYPAIVRAAFERLRVAVRIEARPFRRGEEALRTGQGALGAAVRNAARERVADFSAAYEDEELLVYPSSSGSEYRDLSSLDGSRVGVIRGWSYGDAFDRARAAAAFKVEDVATDEQNFSKLILGRIDFALATRFAAQLYRMEQRIGRVGTPRRYAVLPIHLALPQSLGERGLLERFDREIGAMRKDGTLQRIEQREIDRARSFIEQRSPLAASLIGGG